MTPITYTATVAERPQVAVGTEVTEGGALRTIWADVDLSHGPLRLAFGEWTCGVGEFARRYKGGTARMVRHVGIVDDTAPDDTAPDGARPEVATA